MFSFTSKSKQLIVAGGLALGVFALGACGGGGGGLSPVPQPNQPVTPLSWSGPVNPAGMSITLPRVAGFTESLTLPANDAAPGTTMSIKLSQLAPAGMPALNPAMHVVIPFMYFTLGVSKDVKLNGFPGFTLNVPASFNMGNLPVKIGFYDPVKGWQHIGDFVATGRTVTFKPTTTAVTLKAGVTYYALPYTCGGPSPSPTPTGVLTCTASGTGAIGVLCIPGAAPKTFAFVGKGRASQLNVEQIDISGGASANSTAPPFHTYTDTFEPTNCSGDEKNLRVFCTGFGSSKITDINGNATTNTEFDTHFTGGLEFSGGGCTICAIAFDPIDTAFIIMAASQTAGVGGGEFDRIGESSHAIDMTIHSSDPNENPGYDYVKNWIWNPQYSNGHLEIADFTNGKLFTTASTISGMSEPDSGCVDVATHVAIAGNEFTPPDTVVAADLGGASESGSTLTVTTGTTDLTHTNDAGLDIDACSTDSVIHVTFFQGEFGTNQIGFALMPTTSTGTTISDWAFAPWPLAPDGSFFAPGVDPHTIAGYNDPNTCPDCALSVNEGLTWLAVVDVNAFTKAPRKSGDTHTIDPTYDLVAHHVIAFYKI